MSGVIIITGWLSLNPEAITPLIVQQPGSQNEYLLIPAKMNNVLWLLLCGNKLETLHRMSRRDRGSLAFFLTPALLSAHQHGSQGTHLPYPMHFLQTKTITLFD